MVVPLSLFESLVFPIRDIFQPPFFALFLDGVLDGLGVESHRGGLFAVGLAVELVGRASRYFSCKDWRCAVVETVVGDAGDASVRNTRSSWRMITSAMVLAEM